MKAIAFAAAAALIAVCLAPIAPTRTTEAATHYRHHQHHRHHWKTARGYARHLVEHRFGGIDTFPCERGSRCLTEWQSLDTLIGLDESGWDPCAHWPDVHHDCTYAGFNACGIPQADPCPTDWRGHLYATQWRQVRWLIAYVAGRYGDPINALAHRDAYGWY